MEVSSLISSTSKAISGTCGFVTPLNKNVISRKVLFSERSKVALGDRKKNLRFDQTPSKSDLGEKTKQPDLFLSTPNSKSKNLAEMSTAESRNMRKPMSTACGGLKKLEESWEDGLKMVMDEDTFNLLFVDGPTVGLRPPTPEPESFFDEPELMPVDPSYSDFDSHWDLAASTRDEFELPAINRSFSDDIF